VDEQWANANANASELQAANLKNALAGKENFMINLILVIHPL